MFAPPWLGKNDQVPLCVCLCYTGTAGISSKVPPWKLRPVRSLRAPPHCLKKNAVLAARHAIWISSTHDRCIGRARGPLSPPPRTCRYTSVCARSAMSRHWLITQSPRRRQRHALLTRILLHRFARGGAVRLTVIQFGLELRARPHYTRSLGVGCP